MGDAAVIEPINLAACRVKLGSVEYLYPYCGPRDFWLGKAWAVFEDESKWIRVDDIGDSGFTPEQIVADMLHSLACEVEG